jgi:AAA+ superfamily predicted ATPase
LQLDETFVAYQPLLLDCIITMNLKDFISEALCNAQDCIAYDVSRKLSQMYPNRAIIESSMALFNLFTYARAGQCHIINEDSVFNEAKTVCSDDDKEFVYEPVNAWVNVLWQNTLLDVLFITWTEEGYRERRHWIIADNRDLAENFLRAVCKWSSEVRGEILVFDGGTWSKNEELFKAIKSADFKNLILPAALKQEIQDDFTRFFASRDAYEKYGIPWKRGVLFIGPPGNGKTHTVKALINQLGQPCLYVKSFKACYGTDLDHMRQVFARARTTTPCIVVLEDLDSLVDQSNRSFFLNELDGFAENTGVMVLATTNYPEKLDPAIMERPSRFDRKYYFKLPAEDERLAYINMWNQSLESELRLSAEVLPDLVKQTYGFSFAYLKELFLSSMMEWMANSVSHGMDKVMLNRATILSEQMKGKFDKSKGKATGKEA